MGLVVLGLQQSAVWGWGSVATWACIIVGLLLGVAFLAWERRFAGAAAQPEDLPRPGLLGGDRGAGADVHHVRAVLLLREHLLAGVAGQERVETGLYILYFFIGFVIAAQIGGRILDRRGGRPAVVLGGALGAVGFFLLAGKADRPEHQQPVVLHRAGGRAGSGLMLGTASTDAVNRAPSSGYSEVTGITQTARNFGA